jgi:hypothetical protein
LDDAHDGPYAREPQVDDLVRICRALNTDIARDAVVRVADEIVVDLHVEELVRAEIGGS